MKKLLLFSVIILSSVQFFAQSKEVKVNISLIDFVDAELIKGSTLEVFSPEGLVVSKTVKGKRNSIKIQNQDYVIIVIKHEGYRDQYFALDMVEHQSPHNYRLDLPVKMISLESDNPATAVTEFCFGNTQLLTILPLQDVIDLVSKN